MPDRPVEARAEGIALALMGIGAIQAEWIAPDATWQRSDAPVIIGRAAILDATTTAPVLHKITVEQVTAQGKAATVSGRSIDADGGAWLYCHVIRYTSSNAQQIAQIVSFEHNVKAG